MKTVYSRLKKDIKAEIEKELITNPLSMEILIEDLKSNYNFMEVSYGTFFELQLIAISLNWEKCNRTHIIDFLID